MREFSGDLFQHNYFTHDMISNFPPNRFFSTQEMFVKLVRDGLRREGR